MGIKVKRVPLGFDWPIDTPWHGFVVSDDCRLVQCSDCVRLPGEVRSFDCPTCGGNWAYYIYPDGRRWQKLEPPTGPGYQLWENTTEGSPQSPVHRTLDELADWCATNHPGFANTERSSTAEWRKVLSSFVTVGDEQQERHLMAGRLLTTYVVSLKCAASESQRAGRIVTIGVDAPSSETAGNLAIANIKNSAIDGKVLAALNWTVANIEPAD